jgi:hypothetical protein
MAFASFIAWLAVGAHGQGQTQRDRSGEPAGAAGATAGGGIGDIYKPGVLAAVSNPTSPRDFTGVWVVYRPGQKFPDPGTLPLQAWAAEKVKDFDPGNDDPAASCLSGWPRELTVPYPMELIQTPKFTLFWFEAFNVVRRVWTDGRGHDPDADLSFYGDSIGHWERNTFVVETVSLIHQTLEGGVPLTDGAKTTERWQMIDSGRALAVDVTVDDPQAYTKPIAFRLVFDRTADHLREYMCQENNRNDPLKGQVPGNFLAPRGSKDAPFDFSFQHLPQKEGAPKETPAEPAPKAR